MKPGIDVEYSIERNIAVVSVVVIVVVVAAVVAVVVVVVVNLNKFSQL